MNIQHLQYFEALYRHRKFISAAEELNISQPALSTQIKSLEEYLGFTLFERTTREMTPTESATTLYHYVSKLLLDYNNLDKEIEEIKQFGSGIIHIGMVESAKRWIPQIIKGYELSYPNMDFRLTEMNAIDINHALLNYDIHLGISTNNDQLDSLDYIDILEEKLILITSVEHHFHKYNTIDFTKLENENIIRFTPDYQLKTIISNAHLTAGINTKSKFEVDKLEMALSLVEANLGVAILSENYLKYTSLKNIHRIHLRNPSLSRNIYLGINRKRNLSPAVNDLVFSIKSFFNKV